MSYDDYQGWKNRETWAVNLWMGNEEALYDMAIQHRDDAADVDNLADRLKGMFEEMKNDLLDDPVTYGGYLTVLFDIGSLYRVNWDEIADVMWADRQDDEEEETATDA